MYYPSIKDHISSRDWYDIREAIRANKYWNLTEETNYIVYALALSRARTPAKNGKYVRATGIGQVIAGNKQYWFCRKYRVLLINKMDRTVISVLTWNAFKVAIKEGEKVMVHMIQSDSIPPYINYKMIKSLINSTI
ncbi:MAG: hypothetical protein JRN26_05100 [Nitrososphaerota archaeon]|jgi:hypothetical protein|nr:hypothetical protein [Nitrososphaerota archaeon]MDG6930642.1 hypothetical protein [Nitrososphaerota archaeon]MDG6932477.1 hypothetical protein [Nitrososphaerota archaeon]MDG6936242.1 hypothetical protein [Nitrososphaerota archaeon]MDG6944970.1 hypothetical protein [Nitrososphaerota archaeon]